MASMETQMADLPELDTPEAEGNVGRSLAWIAVAAIGTIFTAGAIVGVIAAATEDGAGLSAKAIAIVAILVAIIGALIYAQWNLARRMRIGGGPMTSKERLNRNIMIGCGVIGAAMGATLVATDGAITAGPSSIFNDDPLPMMIALMLALFWGVVMPLVAWVWHTRAIDEQEANAYRDGGYYAAYAYLIGAPTWWFLWRGGLLPEPDGIAIFMAFMLIWSAVWFWKKYR